MISTKTNASLITGDFKSQIESNMHAVEPEVTPAPVSERKPEVQEERPVLSSAKNESEKKSKYSDVANLHFSTGKRAEFKSFFSSKEITLVQGVELAVNYIMKEVKAGNLTISRNGIEKRGE